MLFDQLGNLLRQRIGAHAFFINGRRASHHRRESTVVIFDSNRGGAFAAFDYHLDLAVLLSL